MRLLFVKQSLAWPRTSGHDVHAYHMMQSLAALGARVSFAVVDEPAAEALRGLTLERTVVLSGGEAAAPRRLPGLQGRFASYFGADPGLLGALAAAVDQARPDAVVAVGLEMLPYLGVVKRATRVWYAADEWVWHHLSRLRADRGRAAYHLKQAAFKGLYERTFASLVDRVWIVSPAERRAARWFGGMRRGDVLPNGVDAEFYAPGAPADLANSAVFWGRLDFGPNVEALRWFIGEVWDGLRRQVPDATFSIAGFSPSDEVKRLAGAPGVSLYPDVADLRPLAARHMAVVLPFVSGGGIKNKLLEAAAMGKPVVCTAHARGGIRAPHAAPLITAETPDEWIRALRALWRSPADAEAIGARTRAWAVEHHSWLATAKDGLAGIALSAKGAQDPASGRLTIA